MQKLLSVSCTGGRSCEFDLCSFDVNLDTDISSAVTFHLL